MRKKLTLAALTFASAVVLAACGAAPGSSSSATGTPVEDTIKVGMNFELSGPVAAYGQAEKNAAELAAEEINKAGGVDGKKLELVVKDNKSENSEAASVASSLVTQDKVNVMVGPATSGATATATPAATKSAVPLITPSGTLDNLTYAKDKVKDYVFRATFQDSFQGQVLAQYATDDLSAKKVVLYYDNSSDYAKGIAKEFKKLYKGEIVSEDTFQSGDKDFQAAVTKFKDKDFDVIVMPGYYTETGLITKQARDLGIDKPILGPDGFNDEKFIENATSEAATDVYYVSGYSTKVNLSEKATNFVKSYKAKFKEEPNMFAALAYDTVYMVADAAKGAKSSTDIAKNFEKIKDFDGVTGKATIDDKHNPVKSAIMIGLKDGKEDSASVVEVKK